jgi:CBS domain-containing protein
MGRHDIAVARTPEEARDYTKALLRDLDSLESMIEQGLIESGPRRLGAEQELFLVDRGWRAAPIATDVLAGLDGKEFTTELGLFNLEINLDPILVSGTCLSDLRSALETSLQSVEREAAKLGAHGVLTGILPTLTKTDLSRDNFTPEDRYFVLNEAMSRMRGGPYRLHIRGVDELNLEHDNVLLEACNTSFQLHLQVSATEFVRFYNVAQAVTAPVLAAAVNSPLLFGRRLWSETRIALFQQAIDTRRITSNVRQVTPRVRFGERWVEGSVLDIYREDIARIPAVVAMSSLEDSAVVLQRGGIPSLDALQLYNGTVYRWNRPCYGVGDGKPHLRIECRVLPAGPSILDEVANAAFWMGTVLGVAERYDDVTALLSFEEARANLVAAARRGLDAGFVWWEGRNVGAPKLILDDLLPLAEEGLNRSGLRQDDVTRYLGIIADRVTKRRTGADWCSASLARMRPHGSRAERLAAVTAGLVARQNTGRPCHEWELADLKEAGGVKQNYRLVEQIMTVDLFTVREDELLDLAAVVMDWKQIRQIPVEDENNRLVGLISYGAVLRQLARQATTTDPARSIPVSQVMDRNPQTIAPEASLRDAVRLMRDHHITSLPVVKDDKLVGIVTLDDFLPLVERVLSDEPSADGESREKKV